MRKAFDTPRLLRTAPTVVYRPRDVCTAGRIEKYIMRKAFDTPESPYLPSEVLWRQKEQFSDGVGYNWWVAECVAQVLHGCLVLEGGCCAKSRLVISKKQEVTSSLALAL